MSGVALTDPFGIVERIGAAQDFAALAAAAAEVEPAVRALHADKVAVDAIAAQVHAWHALAHARLWATVASPALREGSCLLALGSEGRGEQILKTDQDNALLLADGCRAPDVESAPAAYVQALLRLGWPPCPGGVMLDRPSWCQPLSAFRETMRRWVHGGDPQGALNLAIFLDAAAEAGDATLLDQARSWLHRLAADSAPFLARFAAAADAFGEPGPWWQRLVGARLPETLDLKKFGTFPIVHGVRALALQHGVAACGTVARLDALRQRGAVDAVQAGELAAALHALMAVRLTHQLREIDAGHRPDNRVRTAALDAAERASLEAALATVRRFRAFLRRHFLLEYL